MTLREAIALERDYRRVSAEHRAQRVEYWRQRFAQMEAPPVRKVREVAPEPVEPRPSSQEPRYGAPADRRVGQTRRVLDDLATKSRRGKLTDAQRQEAHREEQRRYKERQREKRKPRMCRDCGEPTGRIPRATRCEKCAYERLRERKRTDSAIWRDKQREVAHV